MSFTGNPYQKALEEIETGAVTTIVDNEVVKENVLKLAKSMDLEANVKQDQEITILIYLRKAKRGDNSFGIIGSSALRLKIKKV